MIKHTVDLFILYYTCHLIDKKTEIQENNVSCTITQNW